MYPLVIDSVPESRINTNQGIINLQNNINYRSLNSLYYKQKWETWLSQLTCIHLFQITAVCINELAIIFPSALFLGKTSLFIYLFILLRLGVTYIYKKKTLMTITKPGRDTTTVRTNYKLGSHCVLIHSDVFKGTSKLLRVKPIIITKCWKATFN